MEKEKANRGSLEYFGWFLIKFEGGKGEKRILSAFLFSISSGV